MGFMNIILEIDMTSNYQDFKITVQSTEIKL